MLLIEYKFVTGEKVSFNFEIEGELEAEFLEFEHSQKLVDRKETRRHESLSLFDKDSKNKDIGANIHGKVIRAINKDKLYAAISKLKPIEQELLKKLYLTANPISQTQYAAKLGIKEKSVQEKSRRIRRKLENLIENY